MNTRGITVEPGFIVIDHGSGPPVAHPISEILRQLDIPVGLTHDQVAGVSLLANLMVIVIRTLIDKGILDETFADGEDDMNWDLDHLSYAIEQLGGSYIEPHFDHVEDA